MSYYSALNEFATEEYQLVKPRRKIMPKMADMTNFSTRDGELNRLANFGMEMMKWLPKFEAMYYAGDMYADQEDKDAGNVHVIDHNVRLNSNGRMSAPREHTEVTGDWWNEFNRYGASDDELSYFANADESLADDGSYRPRTNGEAITQYEAAKAVVFKREWEESHSNYGQVADGWGDWWNGFVSGMRHRTAGFGPGSGSTSTEWAGKSFGSSFKNINFYAGGADWVHINLPKTDTPNAATAGDQAYFIGNDLAALGLGTFSALNEWYIENYGNQSYYDFVMSKSFVGISDTDAMKVMLLMKESRSRIWEMERAVFGPVSETRDDAAMMKHITAFVNAHNPYSNYHAISLFGQFFQIQHSITNFMNPYYAGWQGTGNCYALLDKYRFQQFSDAMGAKDYNNYLKQYQGYDIGNCASDESSLLYRYRNGKKDDGEATEQSRYATNLIIDWFDAGYGRDSNPVPSDVKGFTRNSSGKYHHMSYDPNSGNAGVGDWVWVEAFGKYAWRPREAYRSYGYDRKYYEDAIWVSDSDDGSGAVKAMDRAADKSVLWADYVTALGSYINQVCEVERRSHPNYAAAQLDGINSSWAVSGREFNNNWVVHLAGELWKSGGGRAVANLLNRWSQRRRNAHDFEVEYDVYAEKKEEIFFDRLIEQRLAAKTAERRRQVAAAEKRRQAERAAATHQAENQALKRRQEMARLAKRKPAVSRPK